MCRIAGIIGFSDLPIPNITKKMCDLMAHGGPDDEGVYFDEANLICLGNRRLSLLDLSRNGHQPMKSKSGIFWITYNGEVYNYKEIRTELISFDYEFESESDTEVILNAYQKWGHLAFEKLNGMFAIAIYDVEKKELILARDPSGIKPLYYFHDERGLIFSSEIKAFSSTQIKFEENPDWKVLLLAYGHIPEPFTTYKSIQMLGAGNVLKYSFGQKQNDEINYFSYQYSNEINTKDKATTKIRTTLQAGIERQILADAPVGVFLSGGLDSSIIANVAAKYSSHPLKTLSVIFEETKYSEKKYQELLAKKINSDHSFYTITEKDFNDSLPNIFRGTDQPSTDGINTWFIASCAKKLGLKAVLSGIGADELLGGYPSFNRMKTVQLLQQLPKIILGFTENINDDRLSKISFLKSKNDVGQYLFLRGFFTAKMIAAITDKSIEEVDTILNNKIQNRNTTKLEAGNKASFLETNFYMQNQLLKDTDSMSMQHSIEVRVPFLDKKFVETVCSINPKIKFGGKKPKQLLIDAFINDIPREIWDRPKMGFTFPFQKWFKKNELVLQLLKHKNPSIKKLAQMFMEDKIHWSKIYAIIITQA